MKKRNERYQKQKTERVSGDLSTYFILHNIYSGLLFLFFTLCLGIYTQQLEVYDLGGWDLIIYLCGYKFWLMVGKAILILFGCCVGGRLAAYYTIKARIEYKDRKQQVVRATKRWGEYNVGINRMGFKWILSTCITASIYCFGAVTILSVMIFNEQALLPLLTTYALVKIGVYFFVRWFAGRFF